MSDTRGLSYRKSLLDKTIREVPNKLDVVRGIVCTGMKEVLDVFEARMAAQDEGIIIKDLSSKYMPANRSTNHWIKLKADYIDNVVLTWKKVSSTITIGGCNLLPQFNRHSKKGF